MCGIVSDCLADDGRGKNKAPPADVQAIARTRHPAGGYVVSLRRKPDFNGGGDQRTLPRRNSSVFASESEAEMSQTEYETAVAEFIRSKGITRCPTICLAPTQGFLSIADQMALRRRAELREQRRQEKMRIFNHSCLHSIA